MSGPGLGFGSAGRVGIADVVGRGALPAGGDTFPRAMVRPLLKATTTRIRRKKPPAKQPEPEIFDLCLLKTTKEDARKLLAAVSHVSLVRLPAAGL